MELTLDSEGFLINRDQWSADVARVLAENDGYDLNDDHMRYINEARRMFSEFGVVPSLRKFCKDLGISKKDLYDTFAMGPMKLICKWGGLPKPTGCV